MKCGFCGKEADGTLYREPEIPLCFVCFAKLASGEEKEKERIRQIIMELKQEGKV